MTNNENYLDKIPNKILWFRDNGLITIEQKGDLILSFYNEATFYKDVCNFANIILNK